MRLPLPATLPIALAVFLVRPASGEVVGSGSMELSLQGSFLSGSLSQNGTDLGSASELRLGAQFGYFLSSVFELAGTLGVTRDTIHSGTASEESWHSVALGCAAILNIPNESAVLPYLSVGTALINYGGDGFGDQMGFAIPSLSAGIRAFVSPSLAVVTEIGYVHSENLGGWDDLSSDRFRMGLGLAGFFGRE